MNQNLHRKGAKSAKKKKRFYFENSVLILVFIFLCVLCVFAVQGFAILQHSQ